MRRLYDHKDDFEAQIVILARTEGGRETPPRNGIRWDLMYEEDDCGDPHLYIIWPEFINEDGDALPRDLPLSGTLQARMHILNDELAKSVHKGRVQVGTRFFMMEGAHKVARGTVSRVTGLADR
jgi:hypothetical protein